MKHLNLSEALNEISDAHIAEAAAPKKKVRLPWLGAVAALLVVAILATTLGRPMTAAAEGLIAAPEYPELAPYPADFSEPAFTNWREDQLAQYDQPEGYADGTDEFFLRATTELLSTQEGNAACSPLNVYMALAMLAETAAGESRAQVMELLGAADLESLRTQAGHIWNAHYRGDGLSTAVLASSLWLDSEFSYNDATVQTLADRYYASVYWGDLGSADMNTALRDWLNSQTGGLLKEQAQNIELSPLCLLALATTIYYKVQWNDTFNQVNNYEAPFHAPEGDTTATYMFQKLFGASFYQGERYSAINKGLSDGSRMWLILPEEGVTPQALLADSTMLRDVLAENLESSYTAVSLSLPKFDIASDLDLKDSLQALGVTDVFDPEIADFTAILPDEEYAFLSQASHAVRVAADEDGLTAAAYTVITKDDAAAEIDQEIIFTLDRPFFFLIESQDGLPLFSGIVSNP